MPPKAPLAPLPASIVIDSSAWSVAPGLSGSLPAAGSARSPTTRRRRSRGGPGGGRPGVATPAPALDAPPVPAGGAVQAADAAPAAVPGIALEVDAAAVALVQAPPAAQLRAGAGRLVER